MWVKYIISEAWVIVRVSPDLLTANQIDRLAQIYDELKDVSEGDNTSEASHLAVPY